MTDLPQPPIDVGQYDFELPTALVRRRPSDVRGDCRMMVLHRDTGDIEYCKCDDLPRFLGTQTAYVNNSKLRKAWVRLESPTHHSLLAYLIRPLGNGLWLAYIQLSKSASRESYQTTDGIRAVCESQVSPHRWVIRFERDPDLSRVGFLFWGPLESPKSPQDEARYQPLYASVEGSFMSPTAGVSLTREVMAQLVIKELTLHIETNTRYVADEHGVPAIEAEYYEIQEPISTPCTAIGTTVVKAMETWARTGKQSGWSDLFVVPPFEFRVVNKLLTNFHRPRETLLMLTCAFGGLEAVMRAHQTAVRLEFAFSDYGDLLLIV